MNIFQKKAMAEALTQLPSYPIELYKTCPFKKDFAYLRAIQEEVLKSWNTIRTQRDVICKMPTGSGKTLTGLLMLYSKLIEKKEPVVFACPDIQLLEQTIKHAEEYGIPVCAFEDPSTFPLDFLNAKSILVCTFQKLFNGKSIFNRDRIKLGSILLDDAHKCVDIAREQTTVKFPRGHEVSKRLFELFKDSLKIQMLGNYYRLESCDPSIITKVPYWAWMNSHDQIVRILNEYVKKIDAQPKNTDGIKFSWNLLVNNLLSYDCYINGDTVEISPIHAPYHELPSFNEAGHRFILSATFEDDFDLIKDLGISYESITNPIIPAGRNDMGKRLILAPNRFDPNLGEDNIRGLIASYPKQGINTVILVPYGSRADSWEELGATIVDRTNINDSIKKLRNSQGNFMVFVNRYDGIDLINELCRVLVIDGLPMFSTLTEQYTEIRMESMRSSKKAQIIEQGLGRSTRSGGDYSVIYMMGLDLLNFLGYEKNLQYFTPITRTQLEIGLNLLEGDSTSDSIKVISETADCCLTEDKEWLSYHTQKILEIPKEEVDEKKQQRLLLAEIEKKALTKFRTRDYEGASNIIVTDILQGLRLTEKEKAWYYQLAAQFLFKKDIIDSTGLQKKAYNISTNMFFPESVNIEYRTIVSKNVQAAEVKNYIEQFSTSQDFVLMLNTIISDLKYVEDLDSEKFEAALYNLGELLGFSSERPEKDQGNGPDVLWCLTNSHYLILEAKNKAIHEAISRDNVNQLLGSEQWFKKFYPKSSYTLVTLQKSNVKERTANMNPNTKVMDQDCLDDLHNNLHHFGNSFVGHPLNSYSERKINELIIAHSFTPELFITKYLKGIKTK